MSECPCCNLQCLSKCRQQYQINICSQVYGAQPGQAPTQCGSQNASAAEHLAPMTYCGVSSTPVRKELPTTQQIIEQIQHVEWIPCTDQSAEAQARSRAVVAGYEGHDGSPLWVIRAHHEGDIIPGKLAIKHKCAYVPWDGKEIRVLNYEVCVVQVPERVQWVQSHNGCTPPQAIPAGRTSYGETLFIGRAKQQGSLTPGKIHPSHKVMYMCFDGKEIPHQSYEVLCSVTLPNYR